MESDDFLLHFNGLLIVEITFITNVRKGFQLIIMKTIISRKQVFILPENK